MLDPSGVWSVRYVAAEGAAAGADDPEEIATLILGKDGSVSGHDPFGGKYRGSYSVVGGQLRASVNVDKSYDEAETIFEGIDYPLDVELTANYTSPDYFSATCVVNGQLNLVINAQRIADAIS